MDVDRLEAFVVLAELGQLGPAAQQLGKSTSAVSRSISHLEQELGQTLFVRDRSGFAVTGAAEQLLPQARRVLQLHQDFLRTTATIPHRPPHAVVVACSRGVPSRLSTIVLELLELSDGVELRQTPSGGFSGDLVTQLLAGEIDLGLLHLPVGTDALHSLPLLEYDHVVALAADHPLASRESLTAADLAGETIGLATNTHHPALWEPFIARLEAAGIAVSTIAGNDLPRAALAIRFNQFLAVMPDPRYGGVPSMFVDDGIALVPTADPVLQHFRLGLAWRPDLDVAQLFGAELERARLLLAAV